MGEQNAWKNLPTPAPARQTACPPPTAPGHLHLATDADRCPRRADELDAVHPARRRSPPPPGRRIRIRNPLLRPDGGNNPPMTARMDNQRMAALFQQSLFRSPEAISCAEGWGSGGGGNAGVGHPGRGSVNYSCCPTRWFYGGARRRGWPIVASRSGTGGAGWRPGTGGQVRGGAYGAGGSGPGGSGGGRPNPRSLVCGAVLRKGSPFLKGQTNFSPDAPVGSSASLGNEFGVTIASGRRTLRQRGWPGGGGGSLPPPAVPLFLGGVTHVSSARGFVFPAV